MTKITTDFTISRAYAKALFALALRHKNFLEWQQILEKLALAVVGRKDGFSSRGFKVRYQQELGVLYELSKDLPMAIKLIDLLAERKKIKVLPDIARNYCKLLLAHNATLEAKVITAFKLTSMQKKNLLEVLQKHYKCKVLPQYRVDDKLIGGGIIKIDGQVLDNSIKGMLSRLKQCLVEQENFSC